MCGLKEAKDFVESIDWTQPLANNSNNILKKEEWGQFIDRIISEIRRDYDLESK